MSSKDYKGGKAAAREDEEAAAKIQQHAGAAAAVEAPKLARHFDSSSPEGPPVAKKAKIVMDLVHDSNDEIFSLFDEEDAAQASAKLEEELEKHLEKKLEEKLTELVFQELEKESPNWAYVIRVLQNNKNIAKKKKGGYSPLHRALTPSRRTVPTDPPVRVIQWMIDLYPRALRENNRHGEVPLHRACYNNSSIEVLALLIQGEAGREALLTKDNEGRLPLHAACSYSRSVDVARFLIERGGSHTVYEKDKKGRTPLHLASFARGPKSFEVIELLLQGECGRNVLERDEYGCTPLHYACGCFSYTVQPLEIIRLLIRCETGRKALMIKDKNGNLPVHLAPCDRESRHAIEVIKLLVQECPESLRIRNVYDGLPIECVYQNNELYAWLKDFGRSRLDIVFQQVRQWDVEKWGKVKEKWQAIEPEDENSPVSYTDDE